ncbi:MAG: phosphoglucomutase/phosphomannomutase family protein [Propionibacterium sp.]|nr:phosphoglucomutase/phosphomannomutase family protein [Propionibacterium sp.]
MIHFGTGGWREIIGDGFTRGNVRLIAQALADRMHREGVSDRGIVVGFDRRFLSQEAAWWAVEVFVGNGVPVTIIGRPAPTPMFMWTVRNLGCAYGIAVTASHNPALYNGIKLFTEGGRDADIEVTDDFTVAVNALTGTDVKSLEPEEAKASSLVTVQPSLNWYIDSIIDQLDMETIRHRHLHIVLDPMFGVAQTCLQTVLMTARCQVDVINDRHDALFGGRVPSPTASALDGLRRAVIEQHADLGIATDGDADRLGIIDDTGRYLHANEILVLLYHYLLTVKGWTGPAVRNMSTTHLLDRVAAAHGEECYEVPVGFKHISAKMAETDAVIGGESSGGLTVRGHIAGKDGIYAGSLLVEAVAASGKRLSELSADITALYGRLDMVERGYGFSASRREELQQRIFTHHDLPAFGIDVERVRWDDGCKVYFGNGGWVTIRFSGTEPLLRVFCEMPTEREAEEITALVADHYGLS